MEQMKRSLAPVVVLLLTVAGCAPAAKPQTVVERLEYCPSQRCEALAKDYHQCLELKSKGTVTDPTLCDAFRKLYNDAVKSDREWRASSRAFQREIDKAQGVRHTTCVESIVGGWFDCVTR
jgi:hypothetical protein